MGRILFSFQGRLNRKPYWLASFALVIFEIFDLGMMRVAEFGSADPDAPDPAAVIVALGCSVLFLLCAWVAWALAVKRMHDRNRSGWFVLICVIPFLNLWFLIESLLRGTVGENRFGPDPLASSESAVPGDIRLEGSAG
jgi:uncharacterized membrane protein YhaH (DUF805 family)